MGIRDDAVAGRLRWEAALAMGEPAIDSQHRELMCLARALVSLMDEGRYERAVREIVPAFIEKLEAHTVREESLMRRTGYPDLAAHAAEHRRLIHRSE